jgi:CRP-like cAMP-binding protein
MSIHQDLWDFQKTDMKFLDHDPTRHESMKLISKGVFENILADELEELREAGEWGWAGEDELILEVDQGQDYLYVVIKGSVAVYKTHFRSGREQPLAELYEGECFGEMAFLGEGHATANVKAKERTLLWRLSHENLMEYLQDYKGAGQMCLNLAAILAHRLKEGNTRLNGLAAGLSAYFGLKSHLASQEIEAPDTPSEAAEFELPPAVMDSFVRETLRLKKNDDVYPDQTELVEEMLENEKVNVVNWLESGASGHRLKLKLHFVEIDRDGKEIDEVANLTGNKSIHVSEAPTTASPRAKTKSKMAGTPLKKQGKGMPSGKGASKRPGKASPSRKQARTPIPQEEKEPSLLKKLLFPAACVFFVWLLCMIAILLTPGPTKVGWVTNDEGDTNRLMRKVLFPTSNLPFGKENKDWKMKQGEELPFQWNLSNYVTEKGWLEINLELGKPLKDEIKLKLYLEGPDTTDNLLNGKKSNDVWALKKGDRRWNIYSAYISPDAGTDYTLIMDLMDSPGDEWEKAKVKVHAFR